MSSWTSERARVASLTRSRQPDDPDLLAARGALAAARHDLRAARAEDYLRRLVDGAAPLTAEQRTRLAVLLLTPGAPVATASPPGAGPAASPRRNHERREANISHPCPNEAA